MLFFLITNFIFQCDQNTSYVVSPFDLSKDLDSIVKFVDSVRPSGGGDAPEAYEFALRTVRKDFSWTSGPHNKALVMIGDASPHAPSYTTEKIWWRDEVKALSSIGVKIYGVQCGNDTTTKLFYEEMASSTGGVYLDLAKVSLITDMFLAVCYREFGPEALEAYRIERETNNAEPGLKRMLSQLAAGPTTATTSPKKCTADWYALENDHGHALYRFDASTGRFVPIGATSGISRYATPAFSAVAVAPVAPVARSRAAARRTSPSKPRHRRSASPRKTSSKSSRRRARDEEDSEEEEEEKDDAAEPTPMRRNTSYAVGSGDWKRDRLGRMSKTAA